MEPFESPPGDSLTAPFAKTQKIEYARSRKQPTGRRLDPSIETALARSTFRPFFNVRDRPSALWRPEYEPINRAHKSLVIELFQPQTALEPEVMRRTYLPSSR